jgi:hypothetical protein
LIYKIAFYGLVIRKEDIINYLDISPSSIVIKEIYDETQFIEDVKTLDNIKNFCSAIYSVIQDY